MTAPTPWEFTLLTAGAFRITRLVGWDDLTIRPRRWITGVGDAEHERVAAFVDELAERGHDAWAVNEFNHPITYEGGILPISERRFYLSRMLRCPWCLSVYVSVVIYLAWLWLPSVTLGIATIAALSAAVGLTARWLDP